MLRYSAEALPELVEIRVTLGGMMAEDTDRSAAGYGGVTEPCAVVLFGASGDLAKRKVIPALYDLAIHNSLGPRYIILGFARTPMTDESFRTSVAEAAKSISEVGPIDPNQWKQFASNLYYCQGEYNSPDAFAQLVKRLSELEEEKDIGGNRLFYLSTPPEVYPDIVEQLGRAGLARPATPDSWVRIIIEKPFGRDLASAKELNRIVLSVFEEEQVYRIDHYLGKDTVQNLLVLRFGNGIFEPLWNRNYVDHVQITAGETLGVERRGGFYETTGALRDMIQSHVLQLTSLVAVEPPAQFDANSVRNEKLKVLQSIRPFNLEMVAQSVVRGQYGPGKVNGKPVPGYRQEPGVNPNSRTETFVAARLLIDNWRWAGVPFYLRTGKRLAKRSTEIVIEFRRAPHMVFRERNIEPNRLVLNIQPDEGISISFVAKRPGTEMNLGNVTMKFSYQEGFGEATRSAYATLLSDCVRGDATLFDRGDNVEAAWALVDPILEVWSATRSAVVPQYPSGSWGPRESDLLLERDGRKWYNPA
ncbi:MAG TPA: glucose-6-phosphate dehydrogenase [Candidatus Dormibacteraeota bacterium]|nr:glucose-6-phosphate dehydrogenase [Candidatus Dormibacteraeota bacterium]